MKLRKKLIVVTLTLLSALAVAVFAGQGPGGQRGPGGPPPGRPGGPGGPGGGMPLRFLDLTDAQKEQVKAIHEAERARIEPALKQMEEAHKALDAATAKGQFNESQVRAIAATIAQAQTELTVSRARQEAAVYQVLTAEQRAKLDKFREEHQRERPGPPNGQRPQGPPQ